MNERKRGRAKWFNVYERPDGVRTRSAAFAMRGAAAHQARLQVAFNNRTLLYRVRVRYYLEPKT